MPRRSGSKAVRFSQQSKQVPPKKLYSKFNNDNSNSFHDLMRKVNASSRKGNNFGRAS